MPIDHAATFLQLHIKIIAKAFERSFKYVKGHTTGTDIYYIFQIANLSLLTPQY